jgi:hypothetical protein
VGLHKTGSTWLQQEVFPNLTGVTYIGGVARGWLSSIAAGKPEPRPFEVPTQGTVVWSCEVLAGPLWEPVEPEVAAARAASVFPGATILIFTRDPDEWRTSVYGQYVNEGGYLPAGEFWSTVPVARTGLEADRVVRAFEAMFPRVHVLRYEDLQADPDSVARQVADVCGANLAGPVSNRFHNQSLSRPSRAMLRFWNRWFRRSRFNPSPLVAVPQAANLRKVLQRWVDPHLPHRWW